MKTLSASTEHGVSGSFKVDLFTTTAEDCHLERCGTVSRLGNRTPAYNMIGSSASSLSVTAGRGKSLATGIFSAVEYHLCFLNKHLVTFSSPKLTPITTDADVRAQLLYIIAMCQALTLL